MYVKRFLWGVEGVRLAVGSDEEDPLTGGVLLDGSLMVVECVEGGRVGSGDKVGGVGCGIVVSNSSDLNSVEKVRFASSAASSQHWLQTVRYRVGLTFLKVQLAVRRTLLCLRWSCRRSIVVEQAEACLEILTFAIRYKSRKPDKLVS